ALGERGLDGHDVLRFFGSLLGRVAEELEGLDHVVDVPFAEPGEARRLVEVVVAIGKSKATLSCSRDLLGGVLLVLRDGGREEGGTTATVLLRSEGRELLDAGEVVNGLEVGLQWLGAELVEDLGVHAGSEVIAVLLLERAPGSIRSRDEVLVEEIVVIVGKFGETAPRGAVGGDGIVLVPTAAGVLEEVLAGIGGLVDGVDIEGDGFDGNPGRSRAEVYGSCRVEVDGRKFLSLTQRSGEPKQCGNEKRAH